MKTLFQNWQKRFLIEEGVGKGALSWHRKGCITEIYPDAGKFRGSWTGCSEGTRTEKDAVLAKETGEYTLGGPYQLKQGGTGALLF